MQQWLLLSSCLRLPDSGEIIDTYIKMLYAIDKKRAGRRLNMEAILWLILLVVLVGIELATMALTTIWFAGGALAGFFLALAGLSVEWQLGAFVLVSFVCLFFTRPFVAKYINRNTTKTNSDSLVGKQARITQVVDNQLGTGAAVVGGQEWTARSYEPEKRYLPDTMVYIREISGVKLIVSEMREEE